MAKYQVGTEFIDPRKNIQLRIVNYDDCAEMYICEDRYHIKHYRHEETVENAIKGECTMKSFSLKDLSIEELNDLLANIRQEISNRENEARQEAWMKVVRAVKEYFDEYGEITVNINDGEAEYGLDDITCVTSYTGVILV